MSLNIKTFDEMVSTTLQTIVNANVGITDTNYGSVVRTLVESILTNDDMLAYYINYVYESMSIDSATGDDLDSLISILGVVREPATKATGIVKFSTGDEPYAYDIEIPYGTIISTRQNNDGKIYEFIVAENDIILPAGTLTINVNIEAVTAGHTYLPPGALYILNSSIVGIESVINESEINSGKNKETDEALRIRVKEIVKSFGKCTNNALKVAIESIDGVINCTIMDMLQGTGTSSAIIVTETIPAPDSVKLEIDSIIAETKASGIIVFTVYPTIKYIQVAVTITGTHTDSDVLQAISSYVNSLYVGQTFIIRQMERKVLDILDNNNINNDDIDILTSLPIENITCTLTEVIRVDQITINGVIYNV